MCYLLINHAMPPGVQMERILHIRGSVHTTLPNTNLCGRKLTCSLCLCYEDKLCIQLLIHELNLEKKVLIPGLISQRSCEYIQFSGRKSYLIGKLLPWIFKFLFCVSTLYFLMYTIFLFVEL